MSTSHISQPPRARSEPSAREVDAFCVRYAPRDPGHAAIRALCRLLYAPPTEGSLEERFAWVERCVAWLREPRPVHGLAQADEPEAPVAQGRLALLVRVLEGESATRKAVARLVASVVSEARALKLFAQVGLPGRQGFFSELTDRVLRHLLPTPPDPERLSELLLRLFPGPTELAWLESLPTALLTRLFAMVGEPQHPLPAPSALLRAHLVDALILLSTQTAALGLAEDVRDRSPQVSFRASPFLRLRRTCDSVLARDAGPDTLRELSASLAECRQVVTLVTHHLEQSGVSVDLVYRLERLRRGLDRMDAIARVLGTARGEARCREGLALVVDLLHQAYADRSVRHLARTNLRLLARKVIERAGHSGEQSITTTRAEFHALVHSAAGGGLVSALMAAVTLSLGSLVLSPFFSGLAYAVIYVGGFLLMQLLGFALATKQPSMTAAALASAISEDSHPQGGRLKRLVELIPRMTRSQLAAALGNLSCVVPAAVGVALAFQLATGHPLLSRERAQALVDAFHPWRSGTLLWAAFTGVILWLSSVGAGWLENFFVYRRIPEALAHHRGLRRLLGEQGAQRLADGALRHVAGVGGNVSLGLLLGVAPGIGRLFGLPLQVRHVTLTVGALSVAGCTLGPDAVMSREFLAALLGTVGVGILNFGVSFALALALALRARDVTPRDGVLLARLVLRRWWREPRSFLLPPRDAAPTPTEEASSEASAPLAGGPGT
ncbi:site-specific recombinase [Hyalangium rubrum]|uniref:Gliding motility protein n=1 Tax=Hyalangium rubrum TaxID=3103134 RepID=A0ABU5H256_9BACT|nr:gliding motility protein [Hyalangium sp. s54d21]MDY7227526.1 gliding motility protein [Hyalangium sp. s54d21]